MLILFIILLPLLAGLTLLPVKNFALVKKISLSTSIITLILTGIAWLVLRSGHGELLKIDVPWIADIGIRFHIGVDGLSLFMLILTNLLIPFIIFSGFENEPKRAGIFYGLILITQTGLIGLFVALNAILFYVFWEVILIPVYFIILLWGGENRAKITLKFFLYTLFGSLLMLCAFIFIYFQTSGTHSFELSAMMNLPMNAKTQGLLFWCLFIAFAVKMPLFPFHSWMPETYNTAPMQGTMLLSGIMMKMGIYGAIRWLIPILPLGVIAWGNVAMTLAIIGIIYGSWIALKQKNIKLIIAFSSLAHAGLMGASIFSGSIQALQGVAIQMLSHGINIIGLFFIVDLIEQRTKTLKIDNLGGLKSIAPKLTTLFIIIMLGNIALPLTNGFIGEFLMITGIYQHNAIYAAFAGITIIMSAIYMLYMFQKIMLGPKINSPESFSDLKNNELLILVPIALLVILIGVYPQPLLNLTETTMQGILNIAAILK